MKRTRVLKLHASPILGWLLSVIFLSLSPLAYGQPKVTVRIESTGVFEIYPDFVQVFFHRRDTILRASDAPECVAYVRSITTPLSSGETSPSVATTWDRLAAPSSHRDFARSQ